MDLFPLKKWFHFDVWKHLYSCASLVKAPQGSKHSLLLLIVFKFFVVSFVDRKPSAETESQAVRQAVLAKLARSNGSN